jgi:hypothetical protein
MLTRMKRPQSARGRRIEDEADDYLRSGRLLVTHVERHRVEARCVGMRGEYRLGYEPTRGWWCTCTRDPCPHVMALMKVTRPIHPAALESPEMGFDFVD